MLKLCSQYLVQGHLVGGHKGLGPYHPRGLEHTLPGAPPPPFPHQPIHAMHRLVSHVSPSRDTPGGWRREALMSIFDVLDPGEWSISLILPGSLKSDQFVHVENNGYCTQDDWRRVFGLQAVPQPLSATNLCSRENFYNFFCRKSDAVVHALASSCCSRVKNVDIEQKPGGVEVRASHRMQFPIPASPLTIPPDHRDPSSCYFADPTEWDIRKWELMR